MNYWELIAGFVTGAIVPIVLWYLDRRKANAAERMAAAKEHAAELRASEAEEREKAADDRAKAAETREIRADERAVAAEAREKRAEERAIRAEEEIRAVKRRGDAPRFALSDARFNGFYIGKDDGNVGFLPGGHDVLLCSMNHAVPEHVAEGTLIFLVVENIGENATLNGLTSEGGKIRFGVEAKMKDARGLQYFSYPFAPSRLGSPEQFEVSFETRSGRKDTHVYEMIHGKRSLRRVDPE